MVPMHDILMKGNYDFNQANIRVSKHNNWMKLEHCDTYTRHEEFNDNLKV